MNIAQETTATAETTESTESTSTEPTSEELASSLIDEVMNDSEDQEQSGGDVADGDAEAKKPAPKPAKSNKPIDEQIRDLAKDGKFAEIMELCGLDPKQANKIPVERLREMRKYVAKQHDLQRQIDAKREEMASYAQQLHEFETHLNSKSVKVAKAQEAFDAGDLESLVDVISDGKMSVLEFTRALAEQSMNSDPALRRQLQEVREEQRRAQAERERLAAERENYARQQQALMVERGKQNGAAVVAKILSSADDPEVPLAKLAEIKEFNETVRDMFNEKVAKLGITDLSQYPKSEIEAGVRAIAKKYALDLRNKTSILHQMTGQPARASSPMPGANRQAEARQAPRPLPRATPHPTEELMGEELTRALIDEVLEGR